MSPRSPSVRERPRTAAAPGRPHAPDPSPLALGACLFSLSFSTVLFTLALFKLLSFFIMPSLFFDLLFIGFPVGAFLGARFFATGAVSFRRALHVLIGSAFFSIAACLLCKNFDYLRAHIFEVEVPKLLGQIGVFTGLFIPYFCAYGLSEYIGYQWGRERLRGRMRLVYSLYLFGAAAAYVFLKACLGPVGIAGMLGISLAGMGAALALLDRSRRRWLPGAVVAAVGLLGMLPPVEEAFLSVYKGTSPQSSQEMANAPAIRAVSAYKEWGRYSYCEIMWSESYRKYLGLYNDFFQWEYAPGSGFDDRSLGTVPLWTVPPGGSAAIIGAGGGRQVRYGQKFDIGRMLALEIEPAVIRAVRGPLAAGFDRVYEQPKVDVKVTEARSFMEGTEETFDLIYLPSVGGYPQMMLEPGNMIRTHEAYRTLRDRLKPSGLLAIWYPAGLDGKRILTDHYVRTLKALDMDCVAYEAFNRETHEVVELLVLAGRRAPDGPAEDLPLAIRAMPDLRGSKEPSVDFLGLIQRFFIGLTSASPRTAGLSAMPEIEARELPVQVDPLFQPITDEKPFLAGNVRHIFSMEMVYQLFSVLGGVLLLASGAVAVLLRKRGDPGIPGRSYLQVIVVSFLVGANFLLAEHYLVLALFQRLFVFYDALLLGAIGFLVLTGLGSVLITPRIRGVFQALAALSMLALLAIHLDLPARLGFAVPASRATVLVLLAPVAFATGSFFPGIFEMAARNPLGVFALDAVGAAFGSLAAFFIPIAFGFRAFFVTASGVFLATALACWLFNRKLEQGSLKPEA